MDELTAISPLDGRYRRQVAELASYFSEAALIRYRVLVEVEWLLALANDPAVTGTPPIDEPALRAIVENFSEADAAAVKAIEATTNHDVKAVEYFLRARVDPGVHPWVHFAATSEDINNIAYALMLRDALREAFVPAARELLGVLTGLAEAEAATPMLARTHGQPATPTTFGKEMAVFAARLTRQIETLESYTPLAKFAGATGTYAAAAVAFPDADWPAIAKGLVEGLGLAWNPITTQIEPHDHLAEALHTIARLCTVLVDLDADVWSYISLGYLKQAPVPGEVGSSTMPHKVNPINFENSEANASIAIALANHLASTLPVSRLQRDLRDSSALRNVGVVVGHALLAIRNALRGFARVDVDAARMHADLESAWEVLAEAVQTLLRKQGASDAYEALKDLTRGASITEEGLRAFVQQADLDPDDRERLLKLKPEDYTGLAAAITAAAGSA
jgi:adenylosuccinate lyase